MRNELTYPVSLLLVMVATASVFGQLPTGWISKDIGSPAAAGGAQYDKTTETWTIRGDGTGIRGTADQFQFVYKTLTGDGELVARVVSIDPTLADWSMAGVMIRVLLTPGAPYIFMGVSANTDTKDHGITFWGREGMDGSADHESTGGTGAPLWVKVRRAGNTFAGFSSPDGKEWTERYSTTVAGIPNSIYIGYAVTSEVGGQLVTAVFDRGPTTASMPNPADNARNVAAPLFSWTPGITAAFHDVYLGTSPALTAADFRGRQPVTAAMYFHVPGLAPDTTYYWRIDEVGLDGTTIYPGDVWSFSSAPATAYAPQPWDGLDGVRPEATLAWTAGVGALSHDVYFGADRSAVKAGDPATFKGNQLMATYDPGQLAENTTYYWRIDERDSAGAVQPGPVWSFTTIGPGLGVKARYFRGTDPVGDPLVTRTEDAIDHSWGSGEVAGGLSDGVSARWTADLEAPFTETCQLITTSDDGVRLWLDGRRIIDNWTTHGSTDDVATVDLVAGQFYRVEMEWFDNTGGAVARLSWQSPSILRQAIPTGVLQLPVHATNPHPANASASAPQTPILRWTAGESATHHDIYFGEDAQAVAQADSTTASVYQGRQNAASTTFDPGPLEWNRTYFWRVDEVNGAAAGSPWEGSLWSFKTADFLVIDDFESYTDDEGNRIYQTWIDGWANGAGVRVGYLEVPFAEQTIVHGGRQSMPVDYSNLGTGSPQIERSWNKPQNWTVNGGNTLVLYLRGKPTNRDARPFVQVEDSTGHALGIFGNVSDVKTTTWIEWKIPFTVFGEVDMTRVKKLLVHIMEMEPSGPAAGTTGLIFVDDIRVIKQ